MNSPRALREKRRRKHKEALLRATESASKMASRGSVRIYTNYTPPKLEPPKLLHPLLPDTDVYDVEVSAIFGTYNRLTLLKRCVDSIRAAALGIKYEIIVADGGSTDGSREWLSEQPDVVLIKDNLEGAVKAFNACFKVAKGQYILTLNDDATVYPDAIHNALVHFRNPLLGQLAFEFCEKGEWKLQRVHGELYANFGMVRHNVAAAIAEICGGLWATCYQTYGGDTELSCWVKRLGYLVDEGKDCRVDHDEYNDTLRTKNVTTDQKRRQFFTRWPSAQTMHFRGPSPGVSAPEGKKLVRIEMGEAPHERWTRLHKVDPKLGCLPPRAALRPERVLHLHLWTDEDPQNSLAQSMSVLGSAGHIRIDWTKISDKTERGRELVAAATALQPTVIFMQLQGDNVPVDAMRTVRRSTHDPSLVMISWSGDVGPGQGPWPDMKDQWIYQVCPHLDVMLFTGTGQAHLHRNRGMTNAGYLQIGYDIDRYYPGADELHGSNHDVVFLGQDYNPSFHQIPHNDVQLRRDVVSAFQNSGLRFGLFGPNWSAPIKQKLKKTSNAVLHQTQAGDAYRHSAMALSVSVTSNLARYSSDRLIRSMACGCPTLVKRFDDMKGWGLVHKENCLVWDSPQEAVALAQEYLQDRNRLRRIGRAGATLMRQQHTWNRRIEELSAILATVRGQ